MDWKTVGALLCLGLLCFVAVGGTAGNPVQEDGGLSTDQFAENNESNLVVPANDPTATFTSETTEPTVGEEVAFDASGSTGNITTYRWDFTDNGTFDVVSSDPGVSYSYTDPGIYNVTLEVENEAGATNQTSAVVEVSPGPTATFGFSPSNPEAGEEVTFDASGSEGNISEYLWDFTSDGTFDAVSSSPTATTSYANPGEYNVTLLVESDTGATNLTSKVVSVSESSLSADFDFSPSNPSTNDVVSFNASASDGNIIEYRWDFTGDGTFDTVTSNATAEREYTSPGDYNVTLEVENDTGATSQTSTVVSVTTEPTAALDFSPSNPAVGEEVTFDASASEGNISIYRWSFFGDGVDRTTSDPVTNFTYTSPGQFQIGVQVENSNGQTDTNLSSVNVQASNLTAAFNVTPSAPSTGEQVTFNASASGDPDGTITEYRWDFTGNGTIDTVTSNPVTTFEYSSGGSYTVELVVENDTGATDTTSNLVSVTSEASFQVNSLLDINNPLEGEPINVTAEVENVGSGPGTEAVGLQVIGLGTTSTNVTLDVGQSMNVTLSFDTEQSDSGNYTLTVFTDDDSLGGSVTVASNGSRFLIETLFANNPVEGENLTVTGEIDNTGNIGGTQSVEVIIERFGVKNTTVTLDSGASTQVTFDFGTSAGDAGNYTAELSTEDDVSNTSVTVNAPAEFTIVSIDVNTTVEGEKLITSALIRNNGEVPGTQTVSLDVPGVGMSEKNITIDNGSSTEETLSVSSEVGDAGEYTATITTEDNSASANATILNQAEFAVGFVGTNTPVEGEDLDVTFTVENVGDVSGTQTVTLDVGALGTASTEVTLIGNNSIERTLSVGTSAGDAGEYTATVSSEDDTAGTSATVLAPAEFLVDIVGTNTPVEGEDTNVTFTIENPGNISDTQTVTLDVGPLGTTSTSVTLAGGNSTQETLSVGTGVGDAGEYTATVSSADDSVSATVTVIAPAEFVVDIVGTNTPVEGNQLNVTFTAENVGNLSDTQTVTLDIGDLGATSTGVTLAGGESTEETLSIATGAGDAGSYTATVSSANDSDTASVAVEAPASSSLTALDIAGQGADATIVEGKDSNVSVVVENVGDQAGSFDVTLDIGTVINRSQSTGELAAGANATVTFENVTGGLGAGAYSVDVATAGDQISGNLTVNAPAESALSTVDIAGQGADATITEGDSESVSVVVENVGDQAAVFDITLEIGTAVTETASTSELVAGETETVTFGSVTGNLGAGEYSVNVTTADDQTNGTLTVNAPAESAVSALDVAGQGASATITEGDDADISVDVENVGTGTGSFDVTLEIIGNVVEVSKTVSTGQLADGASTTVTFENITGGLDPDPYFVIIDTADDFLNGEVVVEELAPPEFQLTELDPVVTTVTEGNAPIDMNVTVTNQGDASDSQALDLTVTDDDSGTVVYDDTVTGIGLVGGESQTVTFPDVPVGSLDAGSYTHGVSSANESITGSLTVEVPAESALSGLDIAGQGTDAMITAGDDQGVSVVVENVGDQTESFDVNLTIGGAVSQTRSTSQLTGGTSETVTFTGVTGGLSAGAYSVDVSTADDATSGSLTVQAPVASSLSGLDIAGQGTIATLPVGDRETHNVSVNVTNVGDQTGSFDVSLDIGTAVNRTTSTAQLASGQTETVVFQDVAANLTIGTYAVSVSTADDAASGTLTIEALVGLRFPEQNVTAQSEVAVGNVSSEGATLLLVTYEEGGDTVVAGVANGTFDGENVTITLEEDFGFPEQYTAHLLPASEASGNYTPGDTLSSNTSSSVVVSQTARVTTVTNAPDVPVVNAPAKDTTGDGLLDDVRGDGSLDIFDVQTLFSKMDDPVIENNAEFFNFQSGSTPVSIFDIQALFSIYQNN